MWLADHPTLRDTLSISKHDGVELIPRHQLEAAASAIDRLGLKVLGIDAFTLHPDNKIQPSMIDDFPDPSGGSCADYVAEHLGSVRPVITHFEIILDDPK